jgi:hypothetical protein
MTESNQKNRCCCETHYPRRPYTHTDYAFDMCCIGCDKPGIGSKHHNPADNNCCSDCALFCCPCYLVMDIVCCIPMVFGCWIVEEP